MAANNEKQLRNNVLQAVVEYSRSVHAQDTSFTPGDRISYSGRVFDENEIVQLVDSALDFWLTGGRFTEQFERELATFLGTGRCSLVNSGSSANLLAFMALTSSQLGDRAIKQGDEIITIAAAFPTTVSPIIQFGAVPVFVDVEIPSYNIDCSRLEEAVSEKTKAVFLAHTMGNPFNLAKVKNFCDAHRLWLIEDNCDALGARYLLNGEWKLTGTFGDIGTSSFFPAHHLTMGEGGAVYSNQLDLMRLVNSFRDWGRDCWCLPGKDNTCGCRFGNKNSAGDISPRIFGDLPLGYDHKYTYSHFGYNLKATEMQAAIGCAQLEKLPMFVEARKRNWKLLRDGLNDLDRFFILPEPEPNSEPSWFGFLLTVRDDAPFDRSEIVRHLEARNIQTRMLFSGNLLKHPCFDEMRHRGTGYRVVGDLTNTDRIMNQTFWIGVYPGLTDAKIEYMIESIRGTTAFQIKNERSEPRTK